MNKHQLSTPQQNIWNLQSFYSDSGITNISGSVFLNIPLKETLLGEAINSFIKNNNALRLVIRDKVNPYQEVTEHINYLYEILDYSNKNNREIDKILTERSQGLLNIVEQDLYEFIVIKRANDWGLYIKISHIIADAWSMSVAVKEILNAYLMLLKDKNYSMLSSDYLKFLESEKAYQTSERYQKDKTFFEDLFKVEPKLLTFRKNEKQDSIKAKRKLYQLTKKESKKIKDYCEQNNIAPGLIFESALAIYMYRFFNENRIIMGMPVINRSNYEEKQTMGMFISTMPLVVDVNANMNVKDVISSLETSHFNIFKHQRFPFTDIQKILKEKHNYTGRLFDVTVSYQNARVQLIEDIKTENKWYFNGSSETGLVIHIMDLFDEGKFVINFDYVTNIFNNNGIDYLKRRLLTIIDEMIVNSNQTISDIKIMDDKEYKLITGVFNDTDQKYNDKLTVVDMFKNAVNKNPNKIALIFKDREYTYTELDNITDGLAFYLKEQGITKGDRVALLTRRSDYTIFGMLGVIKVGAAYMPLDINYPDDRIDYLLKETNVKLILGYEHNFNNKNNYKIIDFTNINLNKQKKLNLSYESKPSDTYCILHTSGSTGRPKGVELLHEGFVNLYSSKKDYLRGVSHVISLTSLTFDLFRFDTIFPIIGNTTCILASEAELHSNLSLEKLVKSVPTPMLMGVPTKIQNYLLNASDERAFKNVVRYVIGGEIFSIKLRNILMIMSPKAEVFNIYGPTETTVFCTAKRIDKKQINVGNPLPNYKISILDIKQNVVPIGFRGELYISSVGVGKGYTSSDIKYANKFIDLKLYNSLRSYRTGDYAMWTSNGEIEIVGRIDGQVKLRGLRIELSEIENQILNNSVIEVIKVLVKEDKRGHKFLCAYYKAKEEIKISDLRKKLSRFLAQYMIPNYFVKIESIHFNANGKIDITKLPNIEVNNHQIKTLKKPETKLETDLLKLWKIIFESNVISVDDDFFELGGDSLRAIDLLNMIENNLGIKLTIQDIFEHTSIEELANSIKNKKENQEYKKLKLKKIIVNTTQNANDITLLTGATGYLGIHLLKELLDKNYKVMIIVRSIERFKRLFYFYFNINHIHGKLIIVEGDITKDLFGLEENKYNELVIQVGTIIHSAANVRHYGPIKDFYPINVDTTIKLLDLAAKYNMAFNQISTIGVSGAATTRQTQENIIFSEDELNVGQIIEDNVYVYTKYLAELAANHYAKSGLNVNIFRMGNISERYSDGKFQINDDENGYRIRMKAVEKLGYLPEELENVYLDNSYVDKCAESIIKIIESKQYNTYHIFNPNVMPIKDHLRKNNIDFKMISYAEFMNKLNVSDDKYVKILRIYLQHIMDYKNAKMETVNYKTQEVLDKLGFKWEEENEK